MVLARGQRRVEHLQQVPQVRVGATAGVWPPGDPEGQHMAQQLLGQGSRRKG